MIDIHFHCLPGIDDGPTGWADAVELCTAAAASGVDTIVATPHVLRDPWFNEDATARDALIAELNRLLNGRPQVLPGCEFYFSGDAIDLWDLGRSGPLIGLNRSRYLLMEFPAARVPEQAESVLHEFRIIGVHPVIAHPERNVALARDAGRLRRLVELGALTQITAASILGHLGGAIQRVCDEFFELGLVHFVASDAHSLARRPPCLDAARHRVRTLWGKDAETAMFESNPQAVITDSSLSRD